MDALPLELSVGLAAHAEPLALVGILQGNAVLVRQAMHMLGA